MRSVVEGACAASRCVRDASHRTGEPLLRQLGARRPLERVGDHRERQPRARLVHEPEGGLRVGGDIALLGGGAAAAVVAGALAHLLGEVLLEVACVVGGEQ